MKKILPYLVLAAAAVLPFVNIIRQGYFLMDDFPALYLSKDLRLSSFFDPSLYHKYGNYEFFRPLGLMLWRLDYLLFGLDPAGYYVTDVLLHAGCTLLVFKLVSSLAEDNVAGFIAGMVFALHPAHSEAIGWLSCRYDLLATFFYLAALVVYVSRGCKNRMTYAAVLLAEALALMSKEVAITFPAAVFLYEMFYEQGGVVKKSVRAFKKSVPFIILAGVYFLARLYLVGGIGGYGPRSSLSSAGELLLRMLIYAKTLFFGFNPYSSRLDTGLLRLAIFASFVLALILFLSASGKRKKSESFFILLTLLALIPPMLFTPIREDVFKNTELFLRNSRYMYLPSASFAGALGIILVQDRSAGKTAKYLSTICATVILCLNLWSLMDNNRLWLWNSAKTKGVLYGIKEKYPDLGGTYLVVHDFSFNMFGMNYYKPMNFVRAIYFVYGRSVDYRLNYLDEPPGSKGKIPAKLSPAMEKRYPRKVEISFDYYGTLKFYSLVTDTIPCLIPKLLF